MVCIDCGSNKNKIYKKWSQMTFRCSFWLFYWIWFLVGRCSKAFHCALAWLLYYLQKEYFRGQIPWNVKEIEWKKKPLTWHTQYASRSDRRNNLALTNIEFILVLMGRIPNVFWWKPIAFNRFSALSNVTNWRFVMCPLAFHFKYFFMSLPFLSLSGQAFFHFAVLFRDPRWIFSNYSNDIRSTFSFVFIRSLLLVSLKMLTNFRMWSHARGIFNMK